MRNTAIVLLSGGIDSSTALYWAMKQGYKAKAVTYNYRGRVSKEREATLKIAHYAGADCLEVELPFMRTAATIIKENPAAFKGIEVPEGYIPTRNLIFYALGTYYAEVCGASHIIGGHLETDSMGFPDATPNFFSAVEQLIDSTRLGNPSRTIRLLMPFLQKEKCDVLRIGVDLGVPLGLTWSCYRDGEEPCGECLACLDRAEAFARAELKDPVKKGKIG